MSKLCLQHYLCFQPMQTSQPNCHQTMALYAWQDKGSFRLAAVTGPVCCSKNGFFNYLQQHLPLQQSLHCATSLNEPLRVLFLLGVHNWAAKGNLAYQSLVFDQCDKMIKLKVSQFILKLPKLFATALLK